MNPQSKITNLALANFQSKIAPEELQKLNDDIKLKGIVDREHILKFLQLIPTNDGIHIIQEVEKWLTDLHNDREYDTVVFPQNDIQAVIADLDSYGHVSTDTVLKFKEQYGKQVPLA